jgi:hypothetical protein
MAKEKVRRIRRRRRSKRGVVIHKYRYFECAKFFEPSYLIRLALHVFHKGHTVLHVYVTEKESSGEEIILYKKWYDNRFVANARKFLSIVNAIDKVDRENFEAAKKILELD